MGVFSAQGSALRKTVLNRGCPRHDEFLDLPAGRPVAETRGTSIDALHGRTADAAAIPSRRDFCAGAGALVVASALHTAFSSELPAETAPDVATIDRSRIVTAARRYLRVAPVTITASTSPRRAGGKHDYFSEGDYWWPDPQNPAGPYVQRDGMSNPDNFNEHRRALIRLSVQVPVLAAAW